MNRVDLVVPADSVKALRVPLLAISDGTPDPEWVEVPMSTWRFKRQPSLRLPLDPRSAKNARRYIRLAPWSPLQALVLPMGFGVSTFGGLPRPESLVPFVVAMIFQLAWLFLPTGALPRQTPRRSRHGDLRIPEVPVEVAKQWVTQNPGVSATNEPAPRPHSSRFYAVWSTCLLCTSIGLGVVLASDGREDFILLWMLVPVLFFIGVSLALKTQPPARPGTGVTWPS